MKLLMLADGRSPITRRWIDMLQPLEIEIVLVSSYPCETVPGTSRLYSLPLAFASQGGSQAGSGSQNLARKLIGRFRPLAQKVRHWLGPYTLRSKNAKYLHILSLEKPDLVHALRIPYEGMLAAGTPAGIKLILSTWGNDFTLHAPSTPKMTALTRAALARADALHSDTQRDALLAQQWGFDPAKPVLVAPGNGGLDLKELQTLTRGIEKSDPPLVINPRGLRSYVRSDTFFKAIPLVLAERPEVHFACASMAGQAEALGWIEKLGIEHQVRLLPFIPQQELWKLYAQALVSLSISEHDGTPNSLLEAMTLGCLRICGDIESIREWIIPGQNGLLVDPSDEKALAAAILRGLRDEELRKNAAQHNLALIKEKADLETTRRKVKDFYDRCR